MNSFRAIGRALRTVAAAAICWMAVYGIALAQGPDEAREAEGGVWTLPYALVLFGIGLGMLFVCRSSRRRERDKPEKFGEDKIVAGDQGDTRSPLQR